MLLLVQRVIVISDYYLLADFLDVFYSQNIIPIGLIHIPEKKKKKMNYLKKKIRNEFFFLFSFENFLIKKYEHTANPKSIGETST